MKRNRRNFLKLLAGVAAVPTIIQSPVRSSKIVSPYVLDYVSLPKTNLRFSGICAITGVASPNSLRNYMD